MTLSEHFKQATQSAPDPHPLTDDPDPGLREPMDPPVTLRKPSAEYVILLVAQDAGVPMVVAKGWMANLNFQDAVIP